MSGFRRRTGCVLLTIVLGSVSLLAFATPTFLFVVAHPDDELIAAASIYRLAKERGAIVDQLVITNGEGGYRYSTLAERVYGLELTKEDVGRRELPDIRKRELLSAGKILGVRAHYFLDEPDRGNTADPKDVAGVWNVSAVLARVKGLIEREKYDVVFTGLPRTDIGGHHIAAAQLAIQAVKQIAAASRPTLFAVHYAGDAFATAPDSEAAGFSGAPDYDFDRARKFGFNNALDYSIIANWVIAEHKSQGLYQTNVNKFAHEFWWVFNRTDATAAAKAKEVFGLLGGQVLP
jgi:N-acetylglucosamine malate deacetylase 2